MDLGFNDIGTCPFTLPPELASSSFDPVPPDQQKTVSREQMR